MVTVVTLVRAVASVVAVVAVAAQLAFWKPSFVIVNLVVAEAEAVKIS